MPQTNKTQTLPIGERPPKVGGWSQGGKVVTGTIACTGTTRRRALLSTTYCCRDADPREAGLV